MKKMRLNVSPDGRIISMDGNAANMIPTMLKTQPPFPYQQQQQQQQPTGHLPPGAITAVSSNYNNACILNNLTKYYQTGAPTISSAAAANAATAAYASQAQAPLMAPSAMIAAQGGQSQPLQTTILAQTPPSGKEPTTGSYIVRQLCCRRRSLGRRRSI